MDLTASAGELELSFWQCSFPNMTSLEALTAEGKVREEQEVRLHPLQVPGHMYGRGEFSHGCETAGFNWSTGLDFNV